MMLNRINVIFLFVGVFSSELIGVEGTNKDKSKSNAFLKTINKLPYTFKALDRDNKTMIEYKIQKLPKSLYNEAGQFNIKYCICANPLYISLGIPDDKNALAHFDQIISDTQRDSVVCLKKGSNEIVGLNILGIKYSEQKEDFLEVPDERFTIVRNVRKLCGNNIFKKYGVDEYLNSQGLSVHPDYRGRGIAQYLLLAMDVVCRENRIQVAASMFVSIGAAAAANKAGYRYEDGISYAKLAEKYPQINCTKFQHAARLQLSKGQFYQKKPLQNYDYFNPNIQYNKQSDKNAKLFFDRLSYRRPDPTKNLGKSTRSNMPMFR